MKIIELAFIACAILALFFFFYSLSMSPISSEQAFENALSKFGKSPFSVQYEEVRGGKVHENAHMEGFDGKFGYSRTVELSKYDLNSLDNPIVYSAGEKAFRCVDVSTGPCVIIDPTPIPAPADIPSRNRISYAWKISGWSWILSGIQGPTTRNTLIVQPGAEMKVIAGRACDVITVKSIYSWEDESLFEGTQSSTHTEKQCIDRELGIILYLEYEDGSYVQATRVDTQNIPSLWDQSSRVNIEAFKSHYYG